MIKKYFNIIAYLILIIVLTVIYFACFKFSGNGYGYPGYRGYHRHHSFWYLRHHDQTFGTSVRENSLGGSKYSQRGLSGGK